MNDIYALFDTTDPASMSWERKCWDTIGAECVEVATFGDGNVAIRDSKSRERGPLCFTAAEWSAFLADARGQ